MAGKYDTPPPLPRETLARVLRVATIDGRLLLFIAGTCAVFAAYVGDLPGAVVGCCAAGTGALELNGVNRLRASVAEGVEHLIRSQELLLGIVLLYAGYQLANFNPEVLLASVTPAMRSKFRELGLNSDQYLPLLKQSYQAFYVTFGIVSIFYQGGLALYYRRSRATIRRALDDEI